MSADELDLIRRVLVLRKLGKIGALWVENWRFEICMSELDPPDARVWISIGALKALVEEIELTIKIPPNRAETGSRETRVNSDFGPKILVELKNKASA